MGGKRERLLRVELRTEHDLVLARQRARQVAALLGLDALEQTQLATAVSEVARNAQQYAGGGAVEFAVQRDGPAMWVTVVDQGPGIPDLAAVLTGCAGAAGQAGGLTVSRRLVDQLEIDSGPGRGTRVTLRRNLAAKGGALPAAAVEQVSAALAQLRPQSHAEEVQLQNQELLRALDEQRRTSEALERRRAEVERLNQELQETNRGVLALYAELDERAEQLRRASDLKSRFLSYMSHEFRTPLASIRSMAKLLIARMDGDLTPEQERQVAFMGRAAEDLTAMVDDLLDIAKIESGRLNLSVVEIDVPRMLGGLRGMFRPMPRAEGVTLRFDEPRDLDVLWSDEGKLSQILRNLVSNALKFTELGEVRVSARRDGALAVFAVTDTGIGIAPEHQQAIFEEFVQVHASAGGGVKGTGLGLPLSRKLAQLLGGDIRLQSAPGEGSLFELFVPVGSPRPTGEEAAAPVAAERGAPHA